jgi:hypothetical protein
MNGFKAMEVAIDAMQKWQRELETRIAQYEQHSNLEYLVDEMKREHENIRIAIIKLQDILSIQ